MNSGVVSFILHSNTSLCTAMHDIRIIHAYFYADCITETGIYSMLLLLIWRINLHAMYANVDVIVKCMLSCALL
jgi:hypothetical protein